MRDRKLPPMIPLALFNAVTSLRGSTGGQKVSVALSLAVLAMAEHGGFLNASDVYMDKIAVGGGLPDDLVDLDETPAVNLKNLARAKKAEVADLVVDAQRGVREAGEHAATPVGSTGAEHTSGALVPSRRLDLHFTPAQEAFRADALRAAYAGDLAPVCCHCQTGRHDHGRRAVEDGRTLAYLLAQSR